MLLVIYTSLGAEMLPENGAELNYTQVFFRWNQIPNAESYQFTIREIGTGEELELNVPENSVLQLKFFSSSYFPNGKLVAFRIWNLIPPEKYLGIIQHCPIFRQHFCAQTGIYY
jgi:hypothetical protein